MMFVAKCVPVPEGDSSNQSVCLRNLFTICDDGANDCSVCRYNVSPPPAAEMFTQPLCWKLAGRRDGVEFLAGLPHTSGSISSFFFSIVDGLPSFGHPSPYAWINFFLSN